MATLTVEEKVLKSDDETERMAGGGWRMQVGRTGLPVVEADRMDMEYVDDEYLWLVHAAVLLNFGSDSDQSGSESSPRFTAKV